MLYSKSTKGFYAPAIHGNNIPTDAVEITDAEHAALLNGESNGSTIIADAQGKPKLQAPPAATVATTKAAKLAALAAKRYEIETGGITVAGATIMTDPASQAKLTGAWVRMQRLPETVINWKGKNGWSQMRKADVEVIVDAVSNHVQSCFDNERVHSDAITSLTIIAAINAYDITTGWPTVA
jgi:hypothetical protein